MAHGVIWYELITTDQDAAGQFYGQVLPWNIQGATGQQTDYRMIACADDLIGGTMTMPPGAAEMGMKPGWFFYISAPDLEAAMNKILAAGGAIHMPATEVPDAGRFSFVADAQGARFYIMTSNGVGPATSHKPGVAGHGAWHELHARDGASAFAYYADQFGWEEDGVFDMGSMGPYRLFKIGEVQSGGIMTDQGAPQPYWSIYFAVDDIDAAALRVKAAGGMIAHGPQLVPNGSWIINAIDPQGAAFSLVGPKA